ncbi:hypothetical protein [Gloeobacter violaceus]|uniref:hypothetical protein n=1 Tax=Gloeobacter violaceus TaxID=33072 RepID=UPI0013E8C721|nr:hypothetical protein [Gloeobacter violaceus]
MSDTYGKSIQLGASRRRLEDAEVLHENGRCIGAMYIGGYAVECSLKALICHQERVLNLKDTQTYKKILQGYDLHNLSLLLGAIPSLQRAINLDKTGQYKRAWKTVTSVWLSGDLRYSKHNGTASDSRPFVESVKVLHKFILERMGE